MKHPALSPDISLSPNSCMEEKRLAARINMALMRMFRLQTQTAELEKELAIFCEEYFSAVATHLGDYLDFFNAIPEPAGKMGTTEDIHESSIALEAVMKQLYRQLAREFHPDRNPAQSSDTMRAINEAWQQKEFGSLMLLSQSLSTSAENYHLRFTHQDLQHYLERIEQLNEELQQQLERLQQSDLFRLQREMLLARLNGYDMIARVADSLKQRVLA